LACTSSESPGQVVFEGHRVVVKVTEAKCVFWCSLLKGSSIRNAIYCWRDQNKAGVFVYSTAIWTRRQFRVF